VDSAAVAGAVRATRSAIDPKRARLGSIGKLRIEGAIEVVP
jgi:hypothetical protein